MKKTIYVLFLAISSALIMTSCTEEVVKPVTQDNSTSTAPPGGAPSLGNL